jgi:hypothetical protein
MALLPIGMAIQTPTIPCTQRAHKSPLYLLQEQENMTSGAMLTPMGESAAPLSKPRRILLTTTDVCRQCTPTDGSLVGYPSVAPCRCYRDQFRPEKPLP